MTETILSFHISPCPMCPHKHQMEFAIRWLRLFGGRGNGTATAQFIHYQVPVTCPTNNIPFQVTLAIPKVPGQKIAAVKQVK